MTGETVLVNEMTFAPDRRPNGISAIGFIFVRSDRRAEGNRNLAAAGTTVVRASGEAATSCTEMSDN